MIEEKKKRGGARPGAGRPKMDPDQRKVQVGFRLPKDMVDWMRDQPGTMASVIEAAIDAHRKSVEEK